MSSDAAAIGTPVQASVLIDRPLPDEPRAEVLFHRRVRPLAMARELIGAHEVIRALSEREFRARYKQTKVGFAWAVFAPLMMMVIFTVFFGRIAQVDTGGKPYALFIYMGLLPWTFFSSSIAGASISLTSNMSLVNKVYCPREVFPLASICIAVVDTVIAAAILMVLFVVFGEAPHATAVWLPLLIVVQLAFTAGLALVLSATVVYLRDLRQVIPMMLQFALFATPVVYGNGEINASWLPVISAINPLVPVIDGYRRTILFGQAPDFGLLAIGAASSFVLLTAGYVIFKRLETGFADVA